MHNYWYDIPTNYYVNISMGKLNELNDDQQFFVNEIALTLGLFKSYIEVIKNKHFFVHMKTHNVYNFHFVQENFFDFRQRKPDNFWYRIARTEI